SSPDGAAAANQEAMQHLIGRGADRGVQPAVSPDGTTVAFVHHDLNGPGSLWLVNIDGSDPRQIVGSSIDIASPTWSPDGAWIAFSASRVETTPLGVVRPDGTDLHYILFRSPGIEGPSMTPAWSPDGSSIVFSSAPSSGDALADLWLASPDGTGLRDLTQTPTVDETDPTWSPDGTSIAFVTADGIERIPAEGGSAQGLGADLPHRRRPRADKPCLVARRGLSNLRPPGPAARGPRVRTADGQFRCLPAGARLRLRVAARPCNRQGGDSFADTG